MINLMLIIENLLNIGNHNKFNLFNKFFYFSFI